MGDRQGLGREHTSIKRREGSALIGKWDLLLHDLHIPLPDNPIRLPSHSSLLTRYTDLPRASIEPSKPRRRWEG